MIKTCRKPYDALPTPCDIRCQHSRFLGPVPMDFQPAGSLIEDIQEATVKGYDLYLYRVEELITGGEFLFRCTRSLADL